MIIGMSGKVCQLLDQLLHKCEFTSDLTTSKGQG